MTRFLSLCVALFLLAVPAAAQLSETYAGWADGPEGFLLSAGERAAFEALGSDDDAEAWIELFWVRRDPDLNTRINEFKLDFEQRVAAADLQFVEGEGRGALTDRGRVLILVGIPDNPWNSKIAVYLGDLYREDPPRADSVTGLVEMHGLRFNLYEGKALIWEYARERMPASVELGKRVKMVTIAFFDAGGEGEFRLASNVRRAQTAADVLAAMPATFLVNPHLDEVPAFPLVRDAAAATAAQLAWLDADPPTWPEAARAVVFQGVAAEDQYPAWVFVRLPKEAPLADTLVGRLTLADGTVAGTFQRPAGVVETGLGSVYEVMVPAPVGQSKVELALAAGSRALAVCTLDIEIEDVADDATYFTPFFGGAELNEERDFTVGTPFVFGGYHLVLRPDGAYTKEESLNYFCLVVRPGLDEDGQPKVMVRVRLKHKGRQISSTPAHRVELSPVAPNVFMYGAPLPLDFIPGGGEYILQLTLEDKVSGVKRTTALPIVLPEPNVAAPGAAE